MPPLGKNPGYVVHHRPHPVFSTLGSCLAHRTSPVSLKQGSSTSGYCMPSSFILALSPVLLMLKHCQTLGGGWSETFTLLCLCTCCPLGLKCPCQLYILGHLLRAIASIIPVMQSSLTLPRLG